MTLLVLGNPADPVVQRTVREAGMAVKIAATVAELAPESADSTILLNWLAKGDELHRAVSTLPNLRWIHMRQAGVDFAMRDRQGYLLHNHRAAI